MKIRPDITGILWMSFGAAMTLAVVLFVLHFHSEDGAAEQLALRARKVNLVEHMRLGLAAASEAEKSAVLATTDEDSQSFADEARSATAEVERGRAELARLLASDGNKGERDALVQFSNDFIEFQGIDHDLLALAVKNTNLKAASLAFGPAAQAVTEVETALSRLVTKSASSPGARDVELLAFRAQTAMLRIQVLLAPHIAEESDKKMDEMEATIAREDQEVRRALDGLTTIRGPDGDLEAARSGYARFSEIRTRILALSRENTNIRSLSISLNQKRRVMLLCQAALEDLLRVILEKPIAGVDYGLPSNPRDLGAGPEAAH